MERNICDNITQSDLTGLPSNFIAIAIQINDSGVGTHSGFIIGVSGTNYLVHFTGRAIEIEIPVPNGQWYFHKMIDFISPEESETFLAHCERIKAKSNVQFGFIFDGSYYKENGEYFSNSGLPEFSTCVGFCINVITGYLVYQDYFEVNDWESAEIRDGFVRWFRQAQINNPSLNEEDYALHHKRIRPDEYTASGFLDDLPIRKVAVDEVIAVVQQAISSKRA